MRRLERHIVKLEARLTLLEPDSDADSQSPVNTGAAKPSLDVVRDREKERDFGKELNLGTGGLARAGSAATSGAHTRTPSSGVGGNGGNGGLARAGSGATANSHSVHSNGTMGKDKDREVRDKEAPTRDKLDRELGRDKDLREAKVLLREVPVIKRLGRGTPPPPLRTPPQLRTPPPVVR